MKNKIEFKPKRCGVHGCYSISVFINPQSGLRYCNHHRDRLNGRITLDSKSNPPKYSELISLKRHFATRK